MRSLLTSYRQYGFTLVEMLVVSPFIIILVATSIGFIVSLTGEALQTRQKNELSYNTQAALDTIEQTAALSTSVLTTTGVLEAPQGSNDRSNGTNNDNAKDAFTISTPALILTSVGTDKSPLDPSRVALYTGASPCSSDNQLYTYNSVFFVSEKRLLKRTILPTSPAIGDLCATPFQRNSCNPSRTTSNTRCQAKDEIIINNVDSVGIALEYYNNGGSATADTATMVKVTLNSSIQSSGRSVSYSGSTFIKLINNQNN